MASRMLREAAVAQAPDDTGELREVLLELIDHDPAVRAAIKRLSTPPPNRGGNRRG